MRGTLRPLAAATLTAFRARALIVMRETSIIVIFGAAYLDRVFWQIIWFLDVRFQWNAQGNLVIRVSARQLIL